jgi:hypothetical protein
VAPRKAFGVELTSPASQGGRHQLRKSHVAPEEAGEGEERLHFVGGRARAALNMKR